MGGPVFQSEGGLRGWKPSGPGSVRLSLASGCGCEVAVARDGSVRVRVSEGASLPHDPSDAIGREPWRASSAEPYAAEDGAVWLRFEGPEGRAAVKIGGDPLTMELQERDGTILAALTEIGFADGGRASVSLEAAPEDHFFGFGEKSGGLDKRGRLLRMRSQDANLRVDGDPLYASIPFFVAFRAEGAKSRSLGVLLDAFSPSLFDVAAGNTYRYRIRAIYSSSQVSEWRQFDAVNFTGD